LPKVIETDEELERFSEMLESLDRLKRKLTPEEKALEALLGLRPVDMVPVFGSRSVASASLSGKRELSKTHIRKLAEFFHLQAGAFF
jgi:hypothetical protein